MFGATTHSEGYFEGPCRIIVPKYSSVSKYQLKLLRKPSQHQLTDLFSSKSEINDVEFAD